VTTNAPAIPFLSDRLYDLIFRQPAGTGLSELGRAAVEAMIDHGILVDVSHMRQDAIDETFELFEKRGSAMPVIASHGGCRFGKQTYNLTDDTIKAIAARGGVIGLILAQHQLNDGIRRTKTRTLEQSLDVICEHINHIAGITRGYDHVAIGSDLDGFIKPTMGGIESAADLAQLRAGLVGRYGAEVVERMAFANALGVVKKAWQGRPSP
jgi:membrane dipeptidase